MEDTFDIRRAISARGEDRPQPLQVGDCIHIVGCLFCAKTTIEVAADRNVLRVAGDLAYVIDVVYSIFDQYGCAPTTFRGPSRGEHPRVECGADHAIAFNNFADLVIGKLALAGCNTSAVVVAGNYWTAEMVRCLSEGVVG